jgi:CheY-like chemotaxis protein
MNGNGNGSILVVDDDADLRQTLELLLDDSGFTVTAAANGQVALDQLMAGARPDVILLDLMMPDMNGWQFLERAHADAGLAAIPIVIMTARKTDDSVPASSQGVLRKPFDYANLLATISRASHF